MKYFCEQNNTKIKSKKYPISKHSHFPNIYLYRHNMGRFRVVQVEVGSRVVSKLYKPGTMQRFLHDEELFDELHELHVEKGHGGRDIMKKEVPQKFANVTQEIIMSLLACCESCTNKKGRVKKGMVIKPILSKEALSRMQVDFIDLQSCPDGDFKFILHLQDHLTKFCLIAATTNKTAVTTANQLKLWFCIIGAPAILQSDNGREFVNEVVHRMLEDFNIKMVNGKPRHSQSQGSVERGNKDIEDLLFTWQRTNNTSKWAEALPTIQFMKNTRHHRGIGMSPYQAFFGMKPRLGLGNLNLDKEVTDNIWTEEDLETMLQIESSPVEYQIGVQTGGASPRTVVNHVRIQEEEVVEEDTGENQAANKPAADVQECKICTIGGEICEICQRKTSIEEMRAIARKNQELQANQMLERSNKRFKPAEDGDNVNVPIPEVDRGRLDPANFTAVVQNHNEETGLFTLGTKVGTLKTQFSRNQLELLTQKCLTTDDVPQNVEIGVREAACLHSNTGGQGFFKCQCQTKCQSKRCKCNREGVKCNSRCHKNRSWQNHDNVLI